jgi:CBS domain-containing protein
MLKAKDIMKTDVITVKPEMTVEELGRLFIEKDISGAPVVDESGNVLCIVTETDLINREKRFHIPTILRLFDAYITLESRSAMEEEIKRMSARLVKDICSGKVEGVSEETPIEDVATIMTDKRYSLIPVTRGRKLVGIIGRREMLKAISM